MWENIFPSCLLMLAEAFRTVNGKSVSFAQKGKPTLFCMNENRPKVVVLLQYDSKLLTIHCLWDA